MAEEIAGALGAAASLRPPRLEDAGLEDCALPPESIMEAFSRAAISIRSRFATGEDEDGSGCCVEDPGPSNGEIPDALVGGAASALGDEPRPLCGGSGGGDEPGSGGAADEVRVVGVGKEGECGDRVVVVGGAELDGGGKRSCVDGAEEGIRGVDKKTGKGDNEEAEDEEEEGDGEAILVEALI